MYTGELIRLCKLLGILNEINKDFFFFCNKYKISSQENPREKSIILSCLK